MSNQAPRRSGRNRTGPRTDSSSGEGSSTAVDRSSESDSRSVQSESNPGRPARYWMLTIPEASFSPVGPISPGVAYIKGQLELGGNSNYRHWQLLVILSAPQRLSWIRSTFGPFHAEPTRSKAAEEYVWKEDTRIEGTQFEVGRRPMHRNRKTDWDAVWDAAQSGLFNEIPNHVRVPHYRTIKSIVSDYCKPVGMVRSCKVFWGATGTGKSRQAWEEAGFDAYPKDPRSKWWDGYNGHEHVVIDEFRGAIDIAHLLRWLDRYPVTMECKGGSLVLVAKKFWITSNVHPREWYVGLDPETYEALLRRIEIIHFE